MVDRSKMRLLTAALRSGDFRQAKGYLKTQDPSDDTQFLHCCLGVACELAMASGVQVQVSDFINEDGHKTIKFDDRSDFLPVPVQQWFGCPHNDFLLRTPKGYVVKGAQANDNESLTFEEIATGLEEYYGLLEPDVDTAATD